MQIKNNYSREGGAITTNNQNLADKIRKLSLHGMNKDGWNRFKTGSKWQYDVSELGYKYNLTDMAAVFGKWQLKHLDQWHSKRIRVLINIKRILKKLMEYCALVMLMKMKSMHIIYTS